MPIQHTLARPALLAASIALLVGLSSDADAQRRRAAAPKGPPPVTACTDLYSFTNKDWLAANMVVAGQGTRSALGELQALALTQQHDLLNKAMTSPQNDVQRLLGDFWVCCLFPSGRSVMGFKVWSERLAEPMSRGFVATRDSISEVTVVESTPLAGPDGTPRRITATLRPLGAGEPELKITGEVLNGFTLHLLRPFGIGFGHRPGAPDTWIDHHAMVRMELDGETGYGWVERIRLAGVFDGSRPQLVD